MKLDPSREVRLESPERAVGKVAYPGTIVVLEDSGLLEAQNFAAGSKVHYQDTAEELAFCKMCGHTGRMVWIDSEERWQRNPNRCAVV